MDLRDAVAYYHTHGVWPGEKQDWLKWPTMEGGKVAVMMPKYCYNCARPLGTLNPEVYRTCPGCREPIRTINKPPSRCPCGYDGEGYYQPASHPCATYFHKHGVWPENGGKVSDNPKLFDHTYVPNGWQSEISLRDLYIGLAMHALASRVTVQADAHTWITEHAVELADALLAERAKRQG